jgi:cyclase
MVKRTIEQSMFYGAQPKTFEFARKLRANPTKAETILWDKLRNKQLGIRFRSQHPINCFIADFYCHSSKLVIEVDGEIHHYQKEYDINREADIEKFEIKIIRFTNKEIYSNIDRVIEEIKKHL